MLIFLALLAIPLIEIALFILVGDAIGLWPTLGVVVVTALIGSFALRHQGFATLARFRSVQRPEQTSTVLIEGMLLMAAGLLLVTPGVLTDAIGLALLVPIIRRLAAEKIAAHAVTIVTGQATGRASSSSSRAQGSGARPNSTENQPDSEDADARSPFRKRGRAVKAEDAVVIDESRFRDTDDTRD